MFGVRVVALSVQPLVYVLFGCGGDVGDSVNIGVCRRPPDQPKTLRPAKSFKESLQRSSSGFQAQPRDAPVHASPPIPKNANKQGDGRSENLTGLALDGAMALAPNLTEKHLPPLFPTLTSVPGCRT